MNDQPQVLYQKKTHFIIYKPAGWVVNDANTVKHRRIVQKWLESRNNYKLARDREMRSGIVHRLDKETSGLLIIAKDKDSFFDIQAQFKKRTVKKIYTALLHGVPAQKQGTIDAPIGRLPWRRDRFGIYQGGRDAVTGYKVEKFYSLGEEKYSLANFFPKTGRTHQIRVHAKHLGHPVVSDTFYAGRKRSRKDRQWCQRLFLHASFIEFRDPDSGKRVSYNSDLPKDLQDSLQHLNLVD